MFRTPLRRRVTALAVATATALSLTTGTAVAQTAEATLYQPGAAANFSSGSSDESTYNMAFTIFGQVMAVVLPIALIVGIANVATGGQLPQIQLPELPALSAQ